MILTHQDIRHYGFRLDDSVSDEQLDNAIHTAEGYYLKGMIGGEAYVSLYNLKEIDQSYSGGIAVKADGTTMVIEGLARAIAEIAYGCLLRSNVDATAFGTVQKKDDYSQQVDPWNEAKRHYDIGRSYVREWCEWKGVQIQLMEF